MKMKNLKKILIGTAVIAGISSVYGLHKLDEQNINYVKNQVETAIKNGEYEKAEEIINQFYKDRKYDIILASTKGIEQLAKENFPKKLSK